VRLPNVIGLGMYNNLHRLDRGGVISPPFFSRRRSIRKADFSPGNLRA